MSPELKLEMDQTIAATAFPDWEWRDDDEVTCNFSYEAGGGCYTCGYGDPGTEVFVFIQRADYSATNSRTYRDADIEGFWLAVIG